MYGGRLQVLLGICKVLNESFGVKPTFLTGEWNVDERGIKKGYNKSLQFDVKELRLPNLPMEWKIPIFNAKASKIIPSETDLVVNSNNTIANLAVPSKLIHYIHFPRVYRWRQKGQLHGSHKELQSDWKVRAYWSINSFLAKHRKKIFRTRNRGIFLFNSCFTKNCYHELYPQVDGRVVYPGVDLKDNTNNQEINSKKSVVTLGRFSRKKRQLEQIQIAGRVPELNFHICGFTKEESAYYKKCVAAAKKQDNVFLHPNVTSSKKDKLLQEATYFLHTLRNEPFGITTVEAISAGLIPVVPDSGGQKEIVSVPQYRFSSPREAVSILNQDIAKNGKHVSELTKNIRQFSKGEFETKIRQYLAQCI